MSTPSLKSQLFFSDSAVAESLSLEAFEQRFDQSQEVLQQGRNTIKKMDLFDQELVIKSFKRPNAFQGFIYKFLRKSKAQRSFEYASTLISKGINTPKPIGFVQAFSAAQLQQSYYLSAMLNSDFIIRDVLQAKVANSDTILQAFCDFTYHMHQQGVLHLDYSTGNVLINQTTQGYTFSVVDINRLKFGPVSNKDGVLNLTRMVIDDSNIEPLAHAYAKASEQNPEQCLEWLSNAVAQHQTFRQRKRRLKKLIGR